MKKPIFYLAAYIDNNEFFFFNKAFVLPSFEYRSPLLLGVGKTQVKRLEDAIFCILRTVPTNSQEFLRGLRNMREMHIITSVNEIQKEDWG